MGTKWGFARVFRRDQKGGFAIVRGAELQTETVEQCIAMDGELPWRPELNSKIDRIRHANITAARAEMAAVYIGDALARFVPDVVAESFAVERVGTTARIAVGFLGRDDLGDEDIEARVASVEL